MKIVVDANVVIAALAKQSITREALLYPFINYCAPEFLLEELEDHGHEIESKMHADRAGYVQALGIIKSKVKIVKRTAYEPYLKRAAGIIGNIDKDDIPYIAVALESDADGIWSYDKHFRQQHVIRVLSTGELFGLIRHKRF